MTARAFQKCEFELVDMSLEELFPQCKPTRKPNFTQSFDVFYDLIMQVIPKSDRVEFILAEILELQKDRSRATTHVYSCFDKETNGNLIDNYFKIIDGIRESRGWSLSKLDNLYFGQRLWCIHVNSDSVIDDDQGTVEPKWWYDPTRDKSFDLSYDEHEERAEAEIEEMLDDYVTKVHALCLNRYAHSYVLLIPIALNALEEEEYKAKLGAIFLHFSSCEEISKQDLIRIYGRVLLFWHYYFTSELVGKRQRQIEQLKAAQELSAFAQQHMNDILNTLHSLQKPLLNLEMTLSPVCGLIYGGQAVGAFFQSKGPPVRLNGHTVAPIHAWSDEEGRTPEGLKKHQEVTAAVLLKVLGCADSTDPQDSLWQQLCASISQGINGPMRPVVEALVEYIPAVRNQNPEPEEIEKAFKVVKRWFNDAYKPRKHHASLPYSFLTMALRSMNCTIKCEEPLSNDDSFWVASMRPVETIDALAVLNNMYNLNEAVLRVGEDRTFQLEVSMERPHNMNESDASRLEESLESTLNAQSRGDIPRQGNMTYVLSKLFGDKNITRKGAVFSWSDAGREMSMVFYGDSDKMNKILINWVGRVFS